MVFFCHKQQRILFALSLFFPLLLFCHGSATGCLVRVIYPCTEPVELNLYSPWHWNSSVHGLISALKDCRAAVITQACLPVIGLINRLTDDSRLSHPVAVAEGEKRKREERRGQKEKEVAWPVTFTALRGHSLTFTDARKKRRNRKKNARRRHSQVTAIFFSRACLFINDSVLSTRWIITNAFSSSSTTLSHFFIFPSVLPAAAAYTCDTLKGFHGTLSPSLSHCRWPTKALHNDC